MVSRHLYVLGVLRSPPTIAPPSISCMFRVMLCGAQRVDVPATITCEPWPFPYGLVLRTGSDGHLDEIRDEGQVEDVGQLSRHRNSGNLHAWYTAQRKSKLCTAS